MPRACRTNAANYVYHILNRSNARVQIFYKDADYLGFEKVLKEAVEKFDMRLLSFCLMPNHWHLILYPKKDGDLSIFMSWLSNTHTKRWHASKNTVGEGHLYQGRYKSFLIESDHHFLAVVRYVERNAKRAGLAGKAEDWRWSSAWIRKNRVSEQKNILSPWPVEPPENYFDWLNEQQTADEENNIRNSIQRNSPYGNHSWIKQMVEKFDLSTTIMLRGRPKKGG